jgi:hypothetical protein
MPIITLNTKELLETGLFFFVATRIGGNNELTSKFA